MGLKSSPTSPGAADDKKPTFDMPEYGVLVKKTLHDKIEHFAMYVYVSK